MRGEGNWLIVMQLPDMRNKPVGRYRSRAEAEHTKERLMRFTGNRAPYVVMFDPPAEQPSAILPAYPSR